MLTVAAFASAADFKTGLEAYNRGDYAAALAEWRPIAEQGEPNAQYNVGLLYARGQGVPADYAKAAEWYRKAAEQGVAAAQYNLGVMYANGQGVPRDEAQASNWFLKAAGQGMADAHESLGRIYDLGENGFQNYAEAEKWYRQAADMGVASAAFNLGVMYDLGQGRPRDFGQALQWYRKAADMGYAAALTNIAILYYNGQGVKRDLVESYAWLKRAENLGDPRAKDVETWVASKMKPAEIKKAETLASQWQPSAKARQELASAKLFKEPQPAQTGARATQTSPGVWRNAARVVAIGDIHGDYEQFVAALQSAGLIDRNTNWAGGRTHLVQTGDVTGRGPDSRFIMDLLMKLEQQAEAAGGGVHALLGNHEAMYVYGDLRYASPGELAGFAETGDPAARDSRHSFQQSVTAPATPERDRLPEQPEPAGMEALRAAFSPSGKYGKWLRGHNTVIKIDRTLFLHAGLNAKYADWPLETINDEVRAELNDLNKLHGGVATDPDGPLWFGGLAKGDEGQTKTLVDQLLKHFDVDRIVVGHTYAQGAITPRFGGAVILIDAGLSRAYDNIGKLAVLEIENGEPHALHRGQRLDLPKDESGPDMLRYLEQAAALDPKPSPLEERIRILKGSAQGAPAR